MDRFLIGGKRKFKDEEASTSSETPSTSANPVIKPKSLKYDQEYLNFGFTSIEISGEGKPQCVFYFKILAADSMKPNRLKRHLETLHKEKNVDKPREFSAEKLTSFGKQKPNVHKAHTVNDKGLLASYKVAYKIAKCKKPHTIAEQLNLPAAINMVETMFGESYDKQLKNIPLSKDTICRRINDISVDIQQQLESELVGKLFAIQLDEATDSSNESHLVCYTRFCQGAAIVEDLQPIQGRATAVELFRITNDAIVNANLQ